jgi:uncharacterized protein (TIGR02722 family)
VVFANIRNQTSEYLNTGTLSDKMRTTLFESGKVRLVNESRRDDLLKEQNYQAEHATNDTAVKIGRQLGARYLVSGTISGMRSQSPDQVRISRKHTAYYKLTVEVTDLETGLLAWTDDAEFAREANVPIIRW